MSLLFGVPREAEEYAGGGGVVMLGLRTSNSLEWEGTLGGGSVGRAKWYIILASWSRFLPANSTRSDRGFREVPALVPVIESSVVGEGEPRPWWPGFLDAAFLHTVLRGAHMALSPFR